MKLIVRNFLSRERLLSDGIRIGIAVSGGVDSVVLLHILCGLKNPVDLFVIHIDHGARDGSSDDAVFVRNLCDDLGVSCDIVMLESVPERNKEKFWRDARRVTYARMVSEQALDRVLTAHHGTDLVETMLFRFVKGAGPSGLSPFDMKTKPLVEVSKDDIREYAAENNLQWREDKTNNDVNYDRNRIRQNVIPELRHITGNLEKVMLRQAKLMHMVDSFISDSISGIVENGRVKLSVFLGLDPLLKRETLRHLCGGNPSQAELEDCLRWLENNPAGKTEKELGGIILIIIDGFIKLV